MSRVALCCAPLWHGVAQGVALRRDMVDWCALCRVVMCCDVVSCVV